MSFQHPDIKRFLLDAIPSRFAHLTPEEFESFMVYLFGLDGYSVESVPKRGDTAANLLARKDDHSMMIRILQLPPDQVVREDEIHKAEAAKAYHETDQAWIITTSAFTKAAIRVAEKADVEWWDWDALYQALLDTFFDGKSHLEFVDLKPTVINEDVAIPEFRLKVKWQPEEGIDAEWYSLSLTVTNASDSSYYLHLDLPAFIDTKKQQTIADKWAGGEFVSGMVYEGASVRTSALFRATRLGEHPPGGKIMLSLHIRADPSITIHLGAKLKGDACFFVTYCYSRQSPEYQLMAAYRDDVLGKSIAGRFFNRIYYAISPFLIRLAQRSPVVGQCISSFTKMIVKNVRIDKH